MTCTSIVTAPLVVYILNFLSFEWGFFSGLSLFDIQSTEIFVGGKQKILSK